MKCKLRFYPLWCGILVLCSCLSLKAQTDLARANLNVPAQQLLNNYLQTQSELRQKSNSISLQISEDNLDKTIGSRTIRGWQMYNDLIVHGGLLSLHYNQKGELYAIDELLNPNVNATSPTLNAMDAMYHTMDIYGVPNAINLQVKEEKFTVDGQIVFDRGMIAAADMKARLMYYPHPQTGQLHLVWQTELFTRDRQHFFISFIDAQNGELLGREDKALHCQFGGVETDASPAEIAAHAHHHHAMHLQAAAEFEIMLEQQAQIEEQTAIANSAATANEYTYLVLKEPAEAPHDLKAYDGEGGITLDYNPNLDLNELPQQSVTTAGDPVASPQGWHNLSLDGSAPDLAYTHGNNVWAFHDPSVAPLGGVPNPAPEFSAQQRSDGTYTYPWDLTKPPEFQSSAETDNLFPNRNAATTNLFYWNNLVHDVFFHFGFTEANRNFQRNNYTGEGQGNDEILAQSQDGGGTNNANFVTPPDGTGGQMQMFLWTPAVIDSLLQLANGEKFVALEGALYNDAVGGDSARVPEAEDDVQDSEIVIINDGCEGTVGQSSGSTGCGTGVGGLGLPPCNNVAGKIVCIDRGGCSFVEKAYGAQSGGAVGVIVMNNDQVLPDQAIPMGGTDPTMVAITIPSVMVSYNTGQRLRELIAEGTLMGKLQRNKKFVPKKDGDFDNGIIAHEYGHGISTRLSPQTATGGSLGGNEQGGEGWSDFFALYMTMTKSDLLPADVNHPNGILPHRGIGSYILYTTTDGSGIRPRRYSIDTDINEYTFAGDTNGGLGVGSSVIPHGVGFVWCTMLYEMTQNLIDRYGISEEPDRLKVAPNNFAEIASKKADGMNVALRLILRGIQLQVQSPSFTEQRDAILQADAELYGGAHTCDIWRAFAKRGLGVNAVNPTNAQGDEKDGFALPAEVIVNGEPMTCGGTEQIYYDIKKEALTNTVTDGENMTFKITVFNTSPVNSIASNVIVTDLLPENTTFAGATGPVTMSSDNSVTWMIPVLTVDMPVELTVTVKVQTNSGTNIIETYDFEDGEQGWTTSTATSNQWEHKSDGVDAFAGDGYFFVPNSGVNEAVTYLTSPVLPMASGRQLRFYHKFDTDATFDGGFLEGTVDGGTTWTKINTISENGYNGTLNSTFNPVSGGAAYTGKVTDYIESAADLANNISQVRFVFAEDVGFGGGVGWFVDEMRVVNNLVKLSNTVDLTDPEESGGRVHSSTAQVLVLPNPNSDGLAVQLMNLTATPEKSAIRLNWETATEINNNGFYVERLDEQRKNWLTLGFVDGSGSTTTTQRYNYLDTAVKPNQLYTYRLRQVDDSGIEQLSNKVAARLVNTAVSLDISPNPATDFVRVQISNLDEKTTLHLMNITGQLLRTYNISDDTKQLFDIDVSELAAGVYMIQIPTSTGLLVKKLIVE